MAGVIPLFKVFMAPDVAREVGQVLSSGYIGQGPRVMELESRLFMTLRHEVVLLNSCTSAIDLSLHMIGVKPGDEVITTPITCTATNSPIVTRGAIPVWADVDPVSGLIDPADVARKITPRTRAILAVDWGGAPCDWAALRSHGLPVIEDAAHALLTPPGGDYVCYSFQAIKHLTTGDGGALVCPNPPRARLLRWYGLNRDTTESFRCSQNITEVGYKYHMNDVAAAIGLSNLPHVGYVVGRHRSNALALDAQLPLGIYKPPPCEVSSWWIYTLRHPRRGALVAHLARRGIQAGQVHRRNDAHPALHFPNGDLPGVTQFDNTNLAIPVGWWLTSSDIDRIVHAIMEFIDA